MPNPHIGVALSRLMIAVGLALVSIGAAPVMRPALSADMLAPIAGIVQREISSNHIPGAVVLIGQEHEILYRHAFGSRVSGPQAVPMTADTVFDLASLTKVVATTTAVMLLACVCSGRQRGDHHS